MLKCHFCSTIDNVTISNVYNATYAICDSCYDLSKNDICTNCEKYFDDCDCVECELCYLIVNKGHLYNAIPNDLNSAMICIECYYNSDS